MTEGKKPDGEEIIFVNGVSFAFEDVFRVVDDFYGRIQRDPVLSVPFQSVHDWPHHVERLTQFWWLRFGGRPYMFSEYNPVAKHFHAGFNEAFLNRWLSLFHTTIRDHLNNEQIEFWTLLSTRMGQGLTIRNEYYRREHEARIAGGLGPEDED